MFSVISQAQFLPQIRPLYPIKSSNYKSDSSLQAPKLYSQNIISFGAKKSNEPIKEFYLITDNTFENSWLLEKVGKKFANRQEFLGVLLRGEGAGITEEKIKFHRKHKGEKNLNTKAITELESLYERELSSTGKVMIKRYGIPELPPKLAKKTQVIGKNVNAPEMQGWLNEES